MKFKVCCVEPSEPFIYYFFNGGHITTEIFTDIENELLLQLEDEIQKASSAFYDLIITADFVEGEVQYGSGYGDVNVIPNYWILEIVDSEILQQT